MALRSPRPALRPKAMPIKAMARPVTLISGHFMTSNQREERVLNQMSNIYAVPLSNLHGRPPKNVGADNLLITVVVHL